MESIETFVNKGHITVNTDYFPEFEGKSNEEIQEMINSGEYYVDVDLGELMPKSPSYELMEQLGYLDENGVVDYDVSRLENLWTYHNECDVNFDKIKNEKSYIIIED